MSRKREAGFSVVEALIAAAIIVVAGMVALASAVVVARTTSASSGAPVSHELLERTAASLRADAATAFAVFVPPTDVFGAPNGGREVDFYTRDDGGSELFWAYRFDAARTCCSDTTMRESMQRVSTFRRSTCAAIRRSPTSRAFRRRNSRRVS